CVSSRRPHTRFSRDWSSDVSSSDLAGNAQYIGKESNRHEEVDHGLVHDIAEVRATYHDAREEPWVHYVLPLLQELSRRRVATLRSDVSRVGIVCSIVVVWHI